MSAFPTIPQNHGYSQNSYGPGYGGSPGMSLREYFAAHAPEPGIDELAYVLGYPDDHPREPLDVTSEQRMTGVKCIREIYRALSGPEKFAAIARYKYLHADAMLAEGQK